jgi:DNA-binding SARP family transcriptional activator
MVRLLGPIEVILTGGEVVVLPSQSQRRIVAVLGIYAPHIVRLELLCDICALSPGALRKAVSRLRKVFGDALRTDALGYALNTPVDIQQFDRVFRSFTDSVDTQPPTGSDTGKILLSPDSGHILNRPDPGHILNRPDSGQVLNRPDSGQILNRPDPGQALNRPDPGQVLKSPAQTERLHELQEALALWRGDALAEFHGESWAQPSITRLTELRSAAVDDRADQLLLLNRASEAVAALEGQVAREPLRDRSRGLLLRALAAGGRQTDALRAYQLYRAYLAADAGTEPSPTVRDIERRIATGWNGQYSEERSSPQRSDHSEPGRTPNLELGRTLKRFGSTDETGLETPNPGTRLEDSAVSVSPQHARYGHTIAPLPSLLARVIETSLVGRGNELAKLQLEFEIGASVGGLRSVVVSGESGIGKTTLVATFAQSLRAQTIALIAAGRCDEGESVVLKPFREIATFLVDHAPATLLEEHLSAAGSHITRLAPNLARRADIGHLTQEPSDYLPGSSNELTARYLLFEAMADLLRRFAKHQRVVLVLDDVQWAEPTTLLLLRHLNRALTESNLLLVITHRENESDAASNIRAALGELERGNCTRLKLGGLKEDDFATLIAKLANHHGGMTTMTPAHEPTQRWTVGDRTTSGSQQIEALAPQFVKHLFDETAGNPLYTLHLVRQLVESEATMIGRFGLELKRPITELEVPHGIRDVVWSRVSGLGEATVELLSSAALLGREFRVDLLRSLVDLSDQEFNDGIEAGIRSGILQPYRGGQFAQDLAGLRFTHAVVEHSLYEELTPYKRQRLHTRTANTLALLDPITQPELVISLARHCGLAGDFASAMHWCRAAGNQALANLAPNEAAQWYDKALQHALAVQVAAPPLTSALAPFDPTSSHRWAIAELTLQLGKAQRLASKREARATLLTAAELAQQIGSTNMLIQSALANTRGFPQANQADAERIAVIDAALSAMEQLSETECSAVREGHDQQAGLEGPNTLEELDEPNRLAKRGGISGLLPSEDYEPISTVGSLLADEIIGIQSNSQSIRARLLALLSQELLHTSDSSRRVAAAEESLEIAVTNSDTSLFVRIAPEILHALWVPGGAARSNELAKLAVESVCLLGEPLLSYRVYTAYFQAAVQIGDHVGAREAWRLAVEAATNATDPVVRWPLALKEVYEATMTGDLVAAESLAELAYAIGEESGETDALLIFASQIGSIRATQGRIAEILPHVELAAVANPDNLGLQLFLAISCLEVGRTQEAQAVLQSGAKLDFAHIPFDFLWTSTMALYAIIAVDLGDVEVSIRLLELLEPFASENCFNGAISLGCLSGQVGGLASLVGRHDDAERYLLHARTVHRNFGWAFHEASALIGLARTRLARLGKLDAAANGWLDEASVIAEAKDLLRVSNSIAKLRHS